MLPKPLGRAIPSASTFVNSSTSCRSHPIVLDSTRHYLGHQRRPSSSKTSFPPGGPKNSDQAARSPSKSADDSNARDRRSLPSLARRKTRVAAEKAPTPKPPDDVFPQNVPAVASTQHLNDSGSCLSLLLSSSGGIRLHYRKRNIKPRANALLETDIHLSSLFALHRPISVTTSLPRHASPSSFNRIFESRPQSRPDDVIRTLSPGSNGHNQSKDLRQEILHSSQSHGSRNGAIIHLDGPPSIDNIVGQYQPFHKPPPPVPMDESKDSGQEKPSSNEEYTQEQQTDGQAEANTIHKTFKTTLTIDEATDPSGVKTITTEASPIIEQRPRSSTQRHRSSSIPKNQNLSKQPFLARMHSRAMNQAEATESRLDEMLEGEQESDAAQDVQDPRFQQMKANMLLISVKRQRRLKMKKHKYKKLMRRTRNLRKREGRM